jgi:hypothetical protein
LAKNKKVDELAKISMDFIFHVCAKTAKNREYCGEEG